MTVGVQDMTRQNMPLWPILTILSCRHLKTSNYRERLPLSSLICPKAQALGETQLSYVFWGFHLPGRTDAYHRRGDLV